jgi:hypothetical protein
MSGRHRHSYELRQQRICSKKERFASIEDARERQAHAQKNNGLKLVIYQCLFGEHFHLSRQMRDPAITQFRIMQDRALREQKTFARGLI